MIEKFKCNKIFKNIILSITVLFVSVIFSLVVWNIKLSENGNGALLRNNRYFGSAGISQAEIVPLDSSTDYSFNFVAFENLQNLSIYIKPNNANGIMTVSLLTGDWEQILESTVDLSTITQEGFYKIFENIQLPNPDRQVLLLNINNIVYDSDAQAEICSTHTGGTALYATTENKEIAHIFTFLCIMLALMLMAAVLSVANKVDISWLFLGMAIPAVLIYSLLLYPGTACDEHSHYVAAYTISNKELRVADNGRLIFMRETDADLVKDRWESPTIEGVHICSKSFLHRTDRTGLQQINFWDVAYHNPGMINIPTSLGITVARIIGFNAITTYYLARMVNIVLYLLLGFISLRICKTGKWPLFFIMFNPLVINLCTSTNQDGTILPLVFLFISFWSYCCNITAEQNRPMNKIEWLIFIILEILLVPCKVYFLLGILFLFIENNKIPIKKMFTRKNLMIVIPVLAVLVAVVILFFKTNISYASVILRLLNFDPNVEYYSVGYMITHFWGTLSVVLNSIRIETFKWVTDAFGNRVSWETVLNPLYAFVFMAIIIVSSGINQGYRIFSKKEKTGLILVFTMFIVIILVRGLTWTPICNDHISLLTGRYFIPTLPLIFLAVRHQNAKADTLKKVLPLFTIIVSTVYIFDLFINYIL